MAAAGQRFHATALHRAAVEAPDLILGYNQGNDVVRGCVNHWAALTPPAAAVARDAPGLGGPHALRRVPPETWTVTPRLDILTQAQRRALCDASGAATLDDDQARVLLAALAAGQPGTYAALRARPGWADAEAALKEVGLIYSINGPHKVHVSDDVRFSLRYGDDDHIARELGPLGQTATHPARAAEAGPDTCE